MRKNPVKQTLREGGAALGTFVLEFATSGIARLAAEAGAEFLVLDMEHTGWSIETIRMLVATTPASTVPIVRIPAADYQFVARVLDVGAMGIMVPMVQDAAHAQQLVHAAKYPPRGRRGAAFGISHDDYRGGDIREKMASADEEQILIAQIETAAGLDNVEAIAAVDGIDVLWVGHFDLSNSLGIPGQFDHPTFTSAVARVAEVARQHGKIAGFLASGVENAKSLLEQGYRMQAYGGDLWLYQDALRAGLQQVRQGIANDANELF